MSNETAVFEGVRVLGETDKAIRVTIDGAPHWVPKSMIHEDSEVYQSGTDGKLIVAQWWAREKRTSMNTEFAFHLGWMLGGGIVGLFLLWGFYSREQDLAEKFFKSKHGEAIDFSQLAGESGFFVACVISLERERIGRIKAEAERKAVHAYHPHTPFAWLCGAESSSGRAVFDIDKITCPTCKKLEVHGPFGRVSRLVKLEFKE